MQELPHGITENMAYIIKIEAEKRRKGESGGYGKYVSKNDFSKLSEKRKTNEEIVTCNCGRTFERPPGTHRYMCDECKKKNQSIRMKKIWEEKKNGNTTNT